MTLDDMIADFENYEAASPYEAVEWAVENWDLAAPPLLDRLSRFADGTDRRDESVQLVFVALLVMGERREPGAFAPLCRLLHDPDGVDLLFTGAVDLFVPHILISTFNGDLDALRAVVGDPNARSDARAAALDAMSYLAATDSVSSTEMHAYLRDLFDTLQPRAENTVWVGVVMSCARLGLADLADRARGVIGLAWTPEFACDREDFDNTLSRALSDPTGLGCFEDIGLGPFLDAVGALELLDEAAAAEDEDDDDDPVDEDAPSQPAINPLRHVGRNDPCPCGSGKKYKKCCLA